MLVKTSLLSQASWDLPTPSVAELRPWPLSGQHQGAVSKHHRHLPTSPPICSGRADPAGDSPTPPLQCVRDRPGALFKRKLSFLSNKQVQKAAGHILMLLRVCATLTLSYVMLGIAVSTQTCGV